MGERMKYNVDLERECDLTQISIAAAEMNSVLALIEHSRNNEVDFYRYVAYAKELQGGLREMELFLKKDNKALRDLVDTLQGYLDKAQEQ
jgi:hypothetical protein